MKGLKGLILGCLILAWPLAAAAGPRLVIEDTTRDLGKVWAGQTLEGVFEVGNRGDSDLKIEYVTND